MIWVFMGNHYPPTVPDVREKVFSTLTLNVMLAVDFSWMPLIRVRKFPSTFTLLSFYHERVLAFVRNYNFL